MNDSDEDDELLQNPFIIYFASPISHNTYNLVAMTALPKTSLPFHNTWSFHMLLLLPVFIEQTLLFRFLRITISEILADSAKQAC